MFADKTIDKDVQPTNYLKNYSIRINFYIWQFKNMEKVFIKNRKKQKIAVLIEKSDNQEWLVFVMHGQGDLKDSDHIKIYRKSFKDNRYTVVSFDTTNTFGESDGTFEDWNIRTYYEDLEDVIARSEPQDFYQKNFVLCGHSLGAICTAFYAEQYPEKIKALVPTSTVINAKLSKENYSEEELKNWEKTWRLIEDWWDFKVKIKRSYMETKEDFDLLKSVNKLTMPVLMIVWEFDNTTPPKHQQILFQKLPWSKELHIIKDAPHTFRTSNNLQEIYHILDKWIKEKINN